MKLLALLSYTLYTQQKVVNSPAALGFPQAFDGKES